jgi:hypothetical protein
LLFEGIKSLGYKNDSGLMPVVLSWKSMIAPPSKLMDKEALSFSMQELLFLNITAIFILILEILKRTNHQLSIIRDSEFIFLNSAGVLPVCCLKYLKKFAKFTKPHSLLIWEVLKLLSVNNLHACLILISCKKLVYVLPVFILKYLQKECLLKQAIEAISLVSIFL